MGKELNSQKDINLFLYAAIKTQQQLNKSHIGNKWVVLMNIFILKEVNFILYVTAYDMLGNVETFTGVNSLKTKLKGLVILKIETPRGVETRKVAVE